MKYLVTGFVVLALSHVGSGPAKSWTLVPCPQVGPEAEAREKYAQAVRQAEPDTPLYTPHPFPKTKDEIFENVLDYYMAAFADTPRRSLPVEEQRFFDAVASGRVRYDVIKVENWTAIRCRTPKIHSPLSVLRIYDTVSGAEFMRAAVDEVGHLVVAQISPDESTEPFTPFVRLQDAGKVLSAATRANVRDAQYVNTWGTIRCDVLLPCVAVREGESSVLLYTYDGDIYRVDRAPPRFSAIQDLSPARRAATVQHIAKQGRYLVSLGADEFGLAERIAESGEHVRSAPE